MNHQLKYKGIKMDTSSYQKLKTYERVINEARCLIKSENNCVYINKETRDKLNQILKKAD